MNVVSKNQSCAPLKDVLLNLSDELRIGVDLSLGLQESVSDLLARATGVDGTLNTDLQSLDKLTQSLQCLQQYLVLLAKNASDTDHIETTSAAQAIFLKDMALRLSTTKLSNYNDDIPALCADGDVDIF